MDTLRILWLSILMSAGVMGVVAVVVPGADSADPMALTAIGGLAVSCGAASLAWGRLFLREMEARSRWIVRWALAEALSVLGLAVHLLGGPMPAALGLVVCGMLLVAVQFPRGDG